MNNLLREFSRLVENEEYDLGDVVFSPRRTDGAPKNEPNTDFENTLFMKLQRWISSWERLKKPTVDAIKTLIASPKYGNIFKAVEPGNTLYRGLSSVRPEKLEDWLKVTSTSGIPDRGYCGGSWIMKPAKDEITDSYTYDLSVAKQFSSGKYQRPPAGTYSIIFEAKSDDNPNVFFDLDYLISKTRQEGDFLESEVLSLEPVNISKISWKLNS